MKWLFPIKDWLGTIPQGDHPGAFSATRKYDIHTGVDLYTEDGTSVYAVEDGTVVNIEIFTGPGAASPWWEETFALLVEGESGVVCYGEIQILPNIEMGTKIKAGQKIGTVIPVLRKEKIRKDIENHSCFMLHFELYEKGTTKSVWWLKDEPRPKNLLDPTQKLLTSNKNTGEQT